MTKRLEPGAGPKFRGWFCHGGQPHKTQGNSQESGGESRERRGAEVVGAGSPCVAVWPWGNGSASLSLCNFLCNPATSRLQHQAEVMKWAHATAQGLPRGAESPAPLLCPSLCTGSGAAVGAGKTGSFISRPVLTSVGRERAAEAWDFSRGLSSHTDGLCRGSCG